MFNFIGNLKRTNGTFRLFWLAGGAFVFGIGMAAKQFLAILAYGAPLYFPWSLPVALLFVVLFSLMAFVMITFPGMTRYRLQLGSLILSFGVAFLTYFSVLGQPVERLDVDFSLLLLSLLLVYSGTYAAFRLAERQTEFRKILASSALGCTVLLVQLLGLNALHIQYFPYYSADKLNRDIYLLAFIIGIGSIMILMSTLVTWYIDKKLNQMDERYRLLVENSLDTIAIIKQGKWAYVNAAGLQMFEVEQEKDLIGKSIYSFLPPEDHQAVKERLSSLAFRRGSGPVEQDWYTMQGRTLHTEMVETITTLDNEPVVQVIIRDISERKKNEELLINSEKLYVAGQLAAGIAHEIRNPLTSLKGFLQLIASGRKEKAVYYEIMNSELDRIADIVSELLMLSKPQVYELSYHDARQMMKETVTLLETQAILHNIAIETDFGPDPLWVYGVENQVKQVFINVIKNAIEAMADGGAIRIGLTRESDSVLIRITDEGPGIDRDQLSKIGQPFYTTKVKGTGLGLMVSYKIVDNHQGRIDVHSELGKGTTFEIRFPFQYPEAETKKSG
jgi:PAS domain S-box-containing protein